MLKRRRPRIAVLMDENTSTGGTRYEAHKGYFHGLVVAGGAPFGVPYARELVEDIVTNFDGLLAVGGRFAYPNEWYVGEMPSKSPLSSRLEVERAVMTEFLAVRKPVLGICAGMQMLACLHGSRLTPDISEWQTSALAHNQSGMLHRVDIHDGTLLRGIISEPTMTVNTFHREAIVNIGDGITVSANAEDGIVEAVELKSRGFALGIQWHQELFAEDKHPGMSRCRVK